MFGQESVLKLSSADFMEAKIKYDKCICVLFYDDSDESKKAMREYAYVASAIVTPIFAAYYLPAKELITKYGIKLPAIVSFQNHELHQIYNKVMENTAITNFALINACSN